MIYDLGEYNVKLQIPTSNFYYTPFTSHHTQYMWDFIPAVEEHIDNPDKLIILSGVFDNLHEYDHWIKPLNDFKEKHKNKLVVFTGRLTPDNNLTVKPTFHYYRINFFDHVSNVNCKEPTINFDVLAQIERKHKFYWASTKDWYPRRYLLANLFDNNLINDNLINYKCLYSNIPSDYLETRVSIEYQNLIKNKCDEIADKIPLPHLDNTIEFNVTNPKIYNNAYVGIVTDTFYADYYVNTQIFLSEKIYQAINHNQLFFYIGPPHTLDYLENQGYHVFRDVFDTSYDNIEDNGLRLIKATESITNFLNQPLETIRLIYNSNAKKIYQNKVLLRSQKKDVLIYNLLRKVLYEY